MLANYTTFGADAGELVESASRDYCGGWAADAVTTVSPPTLESPAPLTSIK